MRRIVVIGQPAPHGSLCFREFGRMLALRLGTHHVSRESPAAVMRDEAWVASEPAGIFSEALFRPADTVVWLHFSPLAFVRDWSARALDVARAILAPLRRRPGGGAQARPPRASWSHVRSSFDHLSFAPVMYSLLRHPALAQLRVIELRSPRQADFWLMMQRRRSGLDLNTRAPHDRSFPLSP